MQVSWASYVGYIFDIIIDEFVVKFWYNVVKFRESVVMFAGYIGSLLALTQQGIVLAHLEERMRSYVQ